MCAHELLAPPSVLGAWSTTLVIWLSVKYNYYFDFPFIVYMIWDSVVIKNGDYMLVEIDR